MTVIAWDGKTLAADKQITNSSCARKGTKLRKIKRGVVLAITGPFENGLVLMDWYTKGAKPEDWPAFQRTDSWCRLVVADHGKAFTYEQEPIRQPVESPFDAWGSGRDFALGALAMGADAVRAVEVASTFSVECGMGVDSEVAA